MFGRAFSFFVSFLSDRTVEARYVRAGGRFGDAVSYVYMGECIGFKRMLHAWARWEKEYARRGYRTLSLDTFEEYGGVSRLKVLL